ncbi:hypothetical protein DL96DRAFT_1799194 [Flagelloscypha sp. PMI_526]|nr:hypothetical protein DL96DRAFT_1799194 [Flagelloscypha sp. PMI_526]
MCVSATVNGSNVDYVLTSTGSQDVGWMAVGWGTGMIGSDVVILWDNSDGSITLSQRHASGHIMPTVISSPTNKATLVQSLSTTSGSKKSYAFSMPASSTSTGKVNLIYAFGTTKPSSSAVDADLEQHAQEGAFTIDLSSTTSTPTAGETPSTPSSTSGSSSGSNSGSSSSSQPLSNFEKMIVAHGILMSIGFLVLLPIGALLARLSRTFTNRWFPFHMSIQWFISGPIIVVGFALATAAVQQRGGGPLDDHMKWGIVIFVLYLLQLGVGAFIHWVKPSAPRRRPPQNYFHAILGLLIIALAYYQVRDGFKEEYPKATGRDEPKGAQIVWYVWVVLIPVLYIGGLVFLPKQYRQEKELRQKSAQ